MGYIWYCAISLDQKNEFFWSKEIAQYQMYPMDKNEFFWYTEKPPQPTI